jgi:hypothetical protein
VLQRLERQVKHAQAVDQAVVIGAWISEMTDAELVNAPQALGSRQLRRSMSQPSRFRSMLM